MTELSERWDVVVVGTGSGGKIAAQKLARQGRTVLAVEAGRFGGECPYVACVPAKSLLFSARAGLSWMDAVVRRDDAADARDDSGSRDSLTEAGAHTVRGEARVTAVDPDGVRLHVTTTDGTRAPDLSADVVVVATGSRPTIPSIGGLDAVDYWTSDDALSAVDQPTRMVVLGGGAVGCELAQAFQLLGTAVDLVEVADHLLPGEADWVGEAVADQLRADGVRLHLGGAPTRVDTIGESSSSCRIHLADGIVIDTDRVLVAGGRSPNLEASGLVGVGAQTKNGAPVIDGRCRVLDEAGSPLPGVYAVGDLTVVSSYTHSANYQAELVADHLAGRPRDADYRAIPRVVYTEPAVFCVGRTRAECADQGLDVTVTTFDISDVERAQLLKSGSPPGKDVKVRGGLEIISDARTGTVLGASAVGPEADSWAAELTLAVQHRLTAEDLRATMRAFPTWSEAVTAALDD